MKMQAVRRLTACIGATLLALGGSNALALDDDAVKAMLKKSDCTKCHAIDKDKKGPSYQKIAKENKGKADAEGKLIKSMTTSPKVKLTDGSEEEHKKLETKDQAQLKDVAKWILAQ